MGKEIVDSFPNIKLFQPPRKVRVRLSKDIEGDHDGHYNNHCKIKNWVHYILLKNINLQSCSITIANNIPLWHSSHEFIINYWNILKFSNFRHYLITLIIKIYYLESDFAPKQECVSAHLKPIPPMLLLDFAQTSICYLTFQRIDLP